jgi:serine phosphatase RsbU (regulator of sigma subunit)
VASLLLVPIVGSAPIAHLFAPLALLVLTVFGVVYVDLSRQCPRREETVWMHTAVALNLGGNFVFVAIISGMGSRWLADAADAQHLALIARGAGVLLFAGVMAMVLNRRSSRVQREQERLAQEMRAGAEMQELLLPAGNVNVPGFGIEAAYFPMSEVGGDFYWTRAEADGALLVVVGDVSGKGLKAAMLVSVTIGMLRLQRTSSPGAILATLNDGLAGHRGGGFVTCVCARFDPDGQATFASAGHPPPYADGHEVVAAAGLPLGIAAGARYDEFATRFRHLTLVSDGVVEAENAQRELFGFERTREISTKSAREIADAAKAWGQNDDITVVTVRRNR